MKRLSFVRRVFFILAVQLILTAALAAPVMAVDAIKFYVKAHIYLVYIALAITVVLSLLLSCFTKIARSPPTNFILLGIYTAAEGFLIGVAGVVYGPMCMLYAMGATFGIVTVIAVFATQTRFDFTTLSGVVIVLSIVLLILGLVSIFYHNRIYILIYSSIGVAIFGFIMIIDIQMMMGGKHAISFSPEDYVIAALHLYIDIIAIFQYLLQIISNSC